MESRIFYYSLIFSLLIHITVISVFSTNRSIKIFEKQLKQIEVIYKSLPQTKKVNSTSDYKPVNIQKQTKLKKAIKLTNKKDGFIPYTRENIRDISRMIEPFRSSKKIDSRLKISELNKKTYVSVHKPEKITNPKYLNYYDLIGKRIREKATFNLRNADPEQGEVYVTFVLASNGRLEQIKIKEDKTFASTYLRQAAIKSVNDCNPFPPFPKGFDYPLFTFKVSISMVVNEKNFL